MLTKKKRLRGWTGHLLLAATVAWLAGCTPAGPRALLRGKRMIEQGQYADAVDQLKTATSLLPTNALAWNYLGLAYHHANQPANAVEAYQRALRLNRDLYAVHYNLGCLYLDENRPDTLENARNELTAYVLHQENSVEGQLKLGTAQLRLGELVQAETSFRNVLKLDPKEAEAMNDLGVIQLERRRYRDAATYFANATKMQQNYGPAILNLAVTEGYLNNQSAALQRYQEYLALIPRPANWEAVNAIVQQLDQQLNPQLRAPANNVAAVNPVTNNQYHPAPPTNLARPETLANNTRPTPHAPPRQALSEETSKLEVVNLPESQPVQVARQNPAPPPQRVTTDPQGDVLVQPSDLPEETRPEKRGFLHNLFHRSPQRAPKTTPLAPIVTPDEVSEGVVVVESNTAAKPAPPPVVSKARYPYLSPMKPAAGNHSLAEQYLAQGIESQRDRRLSEAVRYYRAAAQADPAYFDAQMSLGLACFDVGDLPEALRAYELALAINPNSFTARFNFALALKRANYIRDSAQELERLLANSPGESAEHLAMVHLTLANLYADQFHQIGPARAHYLKVLELDPHNSQATSIRYWLQENG